MMNSAINTPTVLKKILDRKAAEVARRSKNVSLEALQEQCQESRDIRGFASALQFKIDQGLAAVIAEVKKASPSNREAPLKRVPAPMISRRAV